VILGAKACSQKLHLTFMLASDLRLSSIHVRIDVYIIDIMTYMYAHKSSQPSYKYIWFDVCRQLLRLFLFD